MTGWVVEGGSCLYGAAMGILMLESRFPRIPGDMGNARTWDFPVIYKVVDGASPNTVVRNRAAGTEQTFIDAAIELKRLGARAITTNCGFLSLMQDRLAEATGLPVAASSLMQAEIIQRLLPPGKRIGILTISAATLSPDHLRAAGVPLDTPVVGTDGGRVFTRVILDDEMELDVAASRQDLLDAANELVSKHSDVGAILLECTNMSPYSADIRRLTGLPVFDMYNFVSWFHGSVFPKEFLASAPNLSM